MCGRCYGTVLRMLFMLLPYCGLASATTITFKAGGFIASQKSFSFESGTMQEVYNWLCAEADAKGSTKRNSFYMRATIAGQPFLYDHQTGKFYSIRTDLSRTIQSHMNSHPGLSQVVRKWQSQGKLAPIIVNFDDALAAAGEGDEPPDRDLDEQVAQQRGGCHATEIL